MTRVKSYQRETNSAGIRFALTSATDSLGAAGALAELLQFGGDVRWIWRQQALVAGSTAWLLARLELAVVTEEKPDAVHLDMVERRDHFRGPVRPIPKRPTSGGSLAEVLLQDDDFVRLLRLDVDAGAPESVLRFFPQDLVLVLPAEEPDDDLPRPAVERTPHPVSSIDLS